MTPAWASGSKRRSTLFVPAALSLQPLEALLALAIHTPWLLGDVMYVAGREGISPETVRRAVDFGIRPGGPSRGLLHRYRWHLLARFAAGVQDEHHLILLDEVERREREMLAALPEGAREEKLRLLMAGFGRERDKGTRGPFWYRWIKGEKAVGPRAEPPGSVTWLPSATTR